MFVTRVSQRPGPGVSQLAGIFQHCPGLAPDQCPVQVMNLIEFMINSHLETAQDKNLLNDLLKVVHRTQPPAESN